jgi:carbonic anhydrase/acetyltransferase-like protein (isoleucine patch superfamily)
VPPNRYIPAGQLWAGSPARYVKTLDKPDKIAFFDLRIQYNAKLTKYVAEYTDANSAYLESEVLNEQQGLYSEYNPQQAEERFHERE